MDQVTSVVTVGHVDHGKSTFIGRFLYDTKNLTKEKIDELRQGAAEAGQIEFAHVMDQFQEEREQNITIDTAQIFFNLSGRPFVFIDAPGHKEYLKNMITGATQASNAILLLDVKEGIREQTRKHVQILQFLGITNLAVLINKMDLVSYDASSFNQLEHDIRELLKDCSLTRQSIIPISSLKGENVSSPSKEMPWYQGPSVRQFIEDLPVTDRPQDVDESFQFPIQLIYKMDQEDYALGRVEGGRIKKGETVNVFPTQDSVQVKKISKYKENPKEAKKGESVALVLKPSLKLKRGCILYSGEPTPPFEILKSQSFWASQHTLRVGDEIDVECRTQKASCIVKGIKDEFASSDLEQLENGDIGFLDLEMKSPIFMGRGGALDPFSRLVFHQKGTVVGCGIVQNGGKS